MFLSPRSSIIIFSIFWENFLLEALFFQWQTRQYQHNFRGNRNTYSFGNFFFIRPRSDPSLPMSVTDWLTDWLTNLLKNELIDLNMQTMQTMAMFLLSLICRTAQSWHINIFYLHRDYPPKALLLFICGNLNKTCSQEAIMNLRENHTISYSEIVL